MSIYAISDAAPDNTNCFIRQAVPEDEHGLISLDTYATHDARRCAVIHDAIVSQQCLVAINANQHMGYLVLNHDFFDHGFIALVVVSPRHQRRGVALRLLSAAATACKTSKLFASTNASNLASQAMLAKAGFVPSGRIDNLDDGDPELVYVKHVG